MHNDKKSKDRVTLTELLRTAVDEGDTETLAQFVDYLESRFISPRDSLSPLALRQVVKVSIPTPLPDVHVHTLAEVRWRRHLRSDPMDIYSVGMKFLL